MHIRIARATDNMDEVVRFYRDGLGLDVIGSFTNHAGFDGVMLGRRGESWHLELTRERGGSAGRAPNAESLLVLYFADERARAAAIARMQSHGFAPAHAHNPYWNDNGTSFVDVDGYGVVLARGVWRADLPAGAPLPERSEPHSAQFLTDARDLYWNDDFLSLVSDRRARRPRVQRAVDVGSGLGHWTRRVARMLAPGAEVVGVEREPRWVREAARDGDAGAVRVSYREGAADALPFDDASVDLVTCQTLLIHIGAPERVLAEMRRILKPGGTLLAAEPNNIGGSLAQLACVAGTDVDDLTASVRLEIVCERGKEALGLGFNSLGETLVGLLSPSHWRDTRVWNCDRAYAARAPYPDDALAMLAQERRWHDEGALLWPEDETRRYFLAGGGRDDDFPPLWEAVRRVQAQRFRALDDGSYAGACGGLFYLVAATAS